MSRTDIYYSLNKVFELMMENKLREDMDDTLLEKLLSVIKLKTSEDCTDNNGSKEKLGIMQDLLVNTQVLYLAEKVMISLNEQTKNLLPSIQKFTIELIGVLLENKNVFTLYKDSIILKELSNSLQKNVTTAYAPTVQSALLLCCINIIKHFEGIKWFQEQNLIQFVFSSFASSSYHVRAKAISFFSELLMRWTRSNLSLLPAQEQFLLNDFFESVVLDLISGIQIDGVKYKSNAIDCCLLVLKNSFEIENVKKLINSSSFLKQQFSHYFGSLEKSDTVDEKVLNLLLCIFISGGVSELFIQDILKSLTSHLQFASALILIGSILRDSTQYRPLTKQHMQFLTLPLKILSGYCLEEDMDCIFGLSSSKICDSLSKALEVKSECVKVVISSLLSIAQLTSIMNPEALEDTLMSISIVVSGPTCIQNHPMSYVCLENRNICFALAELLSSLLKEEVYPSIKFQNQLDVINYLMCLMEKPFDYNVANEALKLLGTVIILNDNFSVSLPDDTKEKLVHLLCKKMMDKTETIAMSALSVAIVIMSQDEKQFWKDTVLKQNLHLIVWEMGVDGIQDGMLKAASLQATLQACRVPQFWEDIQSSKRVNEEDVMMIFLRYYGDPDFYIQREALTCIFSWMKDRESTLPLSCRGALQVILLQAVKSLDIEQKDTALRAWAWLIESDRFFPGATKCVDSWLRAVCKSGFASSLVLAIQDYDEAIQFQATNILINFRKTLMDMGLTTDYCVADDSNCDLPQTELMDEFSFNSISKEERDAGIENVMKMTTAEQIAKLTVSQENTWDGHPTEVSSVQEDCLAFPVNSFLKYVWSSNLDLVLSKPAVLMDLISEHTLSLLEDIIASDVKDICRPSDDIKDCY